MKTFEHQCFIKINNEYLLSELNKMGHSICICVGFKDYNCLAVSAGLTYSVHGVYSSDVEDEFGNTGEKNIEDLSHTHINCENNEELFLGIAAISNHDDFLQYFVSSNNTVFKCDEKTLQEYVKKHNLDNNIEYKKLTVKELINLIK